MVEKILFVDDEVNILQSFKRNLRKLFHIETAVGGEAGLRMLNDNEPFAVIVSDMRMPGMDGTEFLARARELSPESVRMLLTGQADMKDAIAVVNKGQIYRFLTKPCPVDTLAKVLNDGIKQYRLITTEKVLIEKTLKGTVKLLGEILSIVNPDAFSRSARMHNMAINVASRLNFKDLWQVGIATMLSQIGCVTIPIEIIRKKNQGQFISQQDNELFLKHVEVGKDLLGNIPRLEKIAAAIAYQEKRYDGSGIPRDKIKGNAIPQIGRILKVVLDYDLQIATGCSPMQAFSQMRRNKSWYDPDVLSALYAEILQVEEGFVIKEISAKDIVIGMVLADDVKTKFGALLIPKGHEISNVLKIRILNFFETKNVAEPIRILEWLDKS